MKLKKSEFKKIVKECLMEILVEGFGEELPSLTEATKGHRRRRAAKKTGQNNNTQQEKIQNAKQQKHIMERVNNITSDPVMASIFAETAATTLQEQQERPGMVAQKGGDHATKLAAQLDPTELAGSSKWADLAFPQAKKI
jgi:hypothetical protein